MTSAADIYMIASPTPRAAANMSSSPLPSPSHLFGSTLASRSHTGSSAVPIPAGAASTFTTASILLREDTQRSLQCLSVFHAVPTSVGTDSDGSYTPRKTVESQNPPTTKEDNQEIKKVAKAPRKATKQSTKDNTTEPAEKKPRKPRAKKVSEPASDTVKERAPRKPRTKIADADADINTVPKEKLARKPRAKKAEISKDSQYKISKGQVTKTVGPSNSIKDKLQEDETVSKHFSNHQEAVKPVLEPLEPEGYGLLAASRRKLNWTPPKPTPEDTDRSKSPEIMDLSDTSSRGFTDMLGSFSFNSNDTKDVEANATYHSAATRKRKLIEMFKTNIPTNARMPKEKAVRKKARTITELAISAYGPAEAQDGDLLDESAPLLKYLGTGEYDAEAVTSLCKPPSKPRSRSPEKVKSKSKKGTAAEPILLSPESALKQVSGQDFVFGTSSQLAREESPTLLRDLHSAMQASNEVDDYDDPFISPPSMIVSRSKAVITAGRNLWSVAARDDRGDLMDVEVVDLVDTPVIKSQNRIMQIQSPVIHTPLNNKDEWVDIDDIEANRPPSTQVEFRQIPVAISMSRFSSSPPPFQNSPQKVINASPRNFSTSSTSLAKSRKASRASSETAEPSMPDYNLLSTPELKIEISKHKFKPVRNRKKMVELLEECWEGSNRPALGVLQGNLPIQKSQASKGPAAATASIESGAPLPKRGPGRPKKDTAIAATSPTSKPRGRPKKVAPVEDLEIDSDTALPRVRTPKKSKKAGRSVKDVWDSDQVLAPSPRRRSTSPKRKKATSPKRKKTTSPPRSRSPRSRSPRSRSLDREDGDELTLSAKREQLFGVISAAVTSAPPSKDPSKPSWHEKILLYDPIVLEDLAIWLNTGALDKVGWDEEVAPSEVKKWCESKSICCLWKENLRGRARNGY
ncbi:structure-specific endonuclease subunit SLX4 protein [Rutstroemia sp. NJR-2017a WRK4]|nr:structure-specific endonuclease subunit SLX4 protein [Rutstroemia sp. NJR-2017a WRK4]